jgi:hypothetical protein
MRNITRFNGMMTAKASEVHPLQSELSFVFTDYSPNANKQAVSKAEAANLIRTGLYMPVKVDFKGSGVGNHFGAIPIGPIISMEDDGERIIGKAVVWKDEYGDVVEYLEEKSKAEGGVQFSWELYYRQSSVDDSGVEWLGDTIVAATTIVDVPAYQGRTPLLSIAAEQRTLGELLQRIELLERQVAEMKEVQMAVESEEVIEVEVEVETEVEIVPEVEAEAETEASDDAPAEDVPSTDIEAELRELRAFKAAIEAEARKQEYTKKRRSSLTEAGILLSDDEFAAQLDFILALDDTAFDKFVQSLLLVQKASKSAASDKSESAGSDVIPDPVTGANSTNVTIAQMAEALRANRNKK